MIPERNTVIEQRKFLCGYQKFEIRLDGELEVTFKRFSTHNQFKFPLWQLNPSPSRVKFAQPGAMIGAIIFGICCIGIVGGMIASKDLAIAAALGFPLFFLGGFFWLSIWNFQTKSVNASVFYFRQGNGQIRIWYERPDTNAFQSFCESLSKKAEDAWNNRPIEPAPQSLAGELTALKKTKRFWCLE